MKNLTYYTLSLSGGKDSTALFLRMIEERMKIDEVVTVDLGDDFPAIYDTLLFVASICLREKIKFTVLTIPETEEYRKYLDRTGNEIGMFRFLAFHHMKKTGKTGYGWCGKQRWGTAIKRAFEQILPGAGKIHSGVCRYSSGRSTQTGHIHT